ncbi:MAG TPA: hypothetical protein VF260_04425 [Bacilli bacterium]
MFDPTVFDNLKVVLEGAVYDLDLAGSIVVTSRSDMLDSAVMARNYAIQFAASADAKVRAEIQLFADMADLAAEMLAIADTEPGCRLTVRFLAEIQDVEADCRRIEEGLNAIWQERPTIKQTVSFTYNPTGKRVYFNTIELDFARKIDERQIADIASLVDVVLQSFAVFR